jgi:hypothetical protein
MVDRWRWSPRVRLSLKAELGQQPSVEAIVLAPTWERLGIVVDMGRIDHGDMIAGAVEGNRESDPIAAGSFEYDQRGLGSDPGGSKLTLEGSKAMRGLLEGTRCGGSLAWLGPSGHEGGGSDINTGDELQVRRKRRHRHSTVK